jgi:hypothetical protein
VKKIILSGLIVALLLGGHVSAPARADSSQDAETLAVVSLAGYDRLFGNVELVGKLAGRPKLAKGLQGMLAVVTHGKGLAGLDTARPWGMVIQADGPTPGGYAFLPVDDFQKFREILEPNLARMEDLGDGAYKVQGKGPRQTAYLKKDSRWLFVCDKLERLAGAPDDPAQLLGELPKQYDLAVRLNLSRFPAAEREKFVARIRRDAERDLQQRPGEDDRQFAVRKMIGTKLVGVFLTVVQDIDTLTLGWSLDEATQRAFLDVGMTAKQSSKTADALGQLGQVETRFAGFRLPNAVMTCHVAATCPHAGSADLGQLFSAIRAQAFEGIDIKEPSQERARVVKDLVGGLLEVVEETVASGRADGAMSLALDAEAATFVSGRYVADGPKLEKTLREFVAAVRKEYPVRAEEVLKTDVAELEGVRLHTLSLDIPHDAENREQVVRLVGERLEIVVGTAAEAVYLAAGRDAMETLKQAIRKSAHAGQEQVPPMELSIALGEFAEFIAETDKGKAKRQAMKAAAARPTDGGDDHLRLTAIPIPRGVKLRLELEKNALRMIEAMHQE